MKNCENKPFIIIGHERSGTSLIAGLVQCCGVNIGNNLLGASKFNVKGHFEEKSILHFHERMLRKCKKNLIDIPANNNIDQVWNPKEAANIVNKAYNRSLPWGWKDPRTILFIRRWLVMFPEAIVLLVIRHPSCVALSLKARNNRDIHNSVDTWMVVHRKIIDMVPRFNVFLYDDLVTSPDIIARFLRSKMKVASNAEGKCHKLLDKNLCHHKSSGLMAPNVNQIWDYLKSKKIR